MSLPLLRTPEPDPAYRAYLQAFVRDFDGPYAIQHPGRPWSTRAKKVSDPLIRAHLDRKYWLALKAPWYPRYACLDLDHPGPETVERVCDRLGVSDGQVLLCTSPSWRDTGNLHVLFAPRYHDEPATKRLLLTILRPLADEVGIEVYPQLRRKCRLPFGRDQSILDDETGMPLALSWQDAVFWAEKLDPFDLSTVPRSQLELPLSDRIGAERWSKRAEAEALWHAGLQQPASRHDACKTLAIYWYRRNRDPGEVRRMLKRWMREKHNGYSKEVARGNWRVVDHEIDEVVHWTWEKYGRGLVYPDDTHNLEGWIASQDLHFIASVFPGDLVNQRRLFKLLLYYRPRQHHEWVFLPAQRWESIAHGGLYTAFRASLEQRGILETIHAYQPGNFSKRIRLKRLPSVTVDQKMQHDGRAIHDYYAALQSLCGSIAAQAEFTGGDRRNFYADRRTKKCDNMQYIHSGY